MIIIVIIALCGAGWAGQQREGEQPEAARTAQHASRAAHLMSWVCVYIYIYIEREREGYGYIYIEREREKKI